MSIALRTADVTSKRSQLKLHLPAEEVASTTCWLINGFPATILIWSADEWARLIDRPEGAQQFPNGIWCVLRVD